MKILGLVLAAATALTPGCRGGGAVDSAAHGEAPALFGTPWTLASMDFEGGFLVMSSSQAHPTLLFARPAAADEPAAVSGFAGVNHFNGECRVGPDSLSFGPLATTRMAGDPERMRLESAYLAHLAGAASYRLSAVGLEVTTGTGKLVFHAPEPSAEPR